VLDHLTRLGITAIELLPVHAFLDDRLPRREGAANYWGYHSIGFFAPEPRYLGPERRSPSSRDGARLHEPPGSR
jgi:isoamylase